MRVICAVHDGPMPPTPGRAEWTDYDLLDAGDGRRLERFGDQVVDRPSPAATGGRRAWAEWRSATARFEAGRGWQVTARAEVLESDRAIEIRPWPILIQA